MSRNPFVETGVICQDSSPVAVAQSYLPNLTPAQNSRKWVHIRLKGPLNPLNKCTTICLFQRKPAWDNLRTWCHLNFGEFNILHTPHLRMALNLFSRSSSSLLRKKSIILKITSKNNLEEQTENSTAQCKNKHNPKLPEMFQKLYNK